MILKLFGTKYGGFYYPENLDFLHLYTFKTPILRQVIF